MANSAVTNNIEHALNTQDFHDLTAQEEDELIRRFPHQFMRDEPLEINGKVVYDGLFSADVNCHHLIKVLDSGIACVKCRGWYCA